MRTRTSRRLPIVSDGNNQFAQIPKDAQGATTGAPLDPLIDLLVDDRYRVRSRMARGGMASVYIAEDERLDRLVALKIMHPHLAESEQFTARFRREARSVAKISHPNVVPIYDQGVLHGQGYLVMELVEGPDLRTFLAESSPFTLEVALTFVEEILHGLAAAHRSGVIHRDLKPENVLVTPDQTLKIVDFGLARAISEISMSSTGSIMGTVAYLAPEVALHGTSDARTDIYAVGIMLYEMLTGTVPGGQANPVQIALSRVNQDVPAPSLITSWLPTEIDEVVAAFCSRNPSERPATALDSAAMIHRLRDNLPADLLAKELPKPEQPPAGAYGEEFTAPIERFGKTGLLPVEPQLVRTSSASRVPHDERAVSGSKKKVFVLVTLLMLLVAGALGAWWWWKEYGPGAYLDVPDVSNMTVEEAEAVLLPLNLASFTTFENSDTVPADLIIGTNPGAEAKIHKNAELELVVSAGVLMITIPDVVDLTPDEATEAIQVAGLTVQDTVEVWSETIEAGKVAQTNPAVGERVKHDTPISIEVSKGRQPIDIPQVVGMSQQDAVAAIEGLGFIAAVTEVYSNSYEAGLVSSQAPETGVTGYLGDTVSIEVSLGPEYVEVPNVFAKSTSEATRILQEAGFLVEIERIAGFFETVGAQSPEAGSQAVRGSAVKITVV